MLAIPKLRRAKQFIRAKAAEWVRSTLWLDRRATSSPIQEFGPTIVFNAAFDGKERWLRCRPAAPRSSHLKNGMHASQKLGRRQSTLGPCADPAGCDASSPIWNFGQWMIAAARCQYLQVKVSADHSASSHFGVLRLGFNSAKSRPPEVGERRRFLRRPDGFAD